MKGDDSMSLVNYDFDALNQSLDDVGTVMTNVNSLTGTIDSFLGGNVVDSRVIEYLPEINSLLSLNQADTGISSVNENLGYDNTAMDHFGDWLGATISAALSTKEETEEIAESAENFDGNDTTSSTTGGNGSAQSVTISAGSGGVGSISSGSGSASSIQISEPSSNTVPVENGNGDAISVDEDVVDSAWEHLSPSVQDTIKSKLKEVGYSDSEIETITHGEVTIDGVTLQQVASQLEAAYANDPSIRQRIIDLYGIDIFNADGTVNQDLLSYILLIDKKNPNDAYDILALIKGNPSSSNTTPDPSILSPEEKTPEEEHTHIGDTVGGIDYPNSTELSLEDQKSLDEMISSDSQSITDTVSSASTSVSQTIRPTNPIRSGGVSKSHTGAVATAIAVGAAGALTSGGAIAVRSKRRKDNDDDSYLDDDFFDVKEEELSEEEMVGAQQKHDKEWLYGLGIGLGAATGAASVFEKRRKDRDDDEEKQDYDDGRNAEEVVVF